MYYRIILHILYLIIFEACNLLLMFWPWGCCICSDCSPPEITQLWNLFFIWSTLSRCLFVMCFFRVITKTKFWHTWYLYFQFLLFFPLKWTTFAINLLSSRSLLVAIAIDEKTGENWVFVIILCKRTLSREGYQRWCF